MNQKMELNGRRERNGREGRRKGKVYKRQKPVDEDGLNGVVKIRRRPTLPLTQYHRLTRA